MKVGFSLSRCITDIVTGKVKFDDVAVLMCGTLIENEEQLEMVILSYYRINSYFDVAIDIQRYQSIARLLWDHGKIHQYRLSPSGWRPPVPNQYVWMDLVPTSVSDDDNIKKAWDNYQLFLKMSSPEKLPDAISRFGDT